MHAHRRPLSSRLVSRLAGALALLAQPVGVHGASRCLSDCAAAAQSCVAVRLQERVSTAAACVGTKREQRRCKKKAKTRFARAKRACKGKTQQGCQRCCRKGGTSDQCAVVPAPGPVPEPGPEPEPGSCKTGVYRAFVGGEVFESPASCGDGVQFTLNPTHAIRLRIVGPDGQPQSGPGSRADASAELRDPPSSPQGVTLGASGVPDDDGRLVMQVTDGQYVVRIAASTDCAAGFAPQELAPVTVSGADVDLGTVTLQRRSLVRVYGKVTGLAAADPGSGLAGAPLVTGVWSSSDRQLGCGTSASAVKQPDGTADYELHLPPGRILLRATQLAHDVACSVDIAGARQLLARDLTETAVDTRIDLSLVPSVALAGTLLAPDGSPAAGMLVVEIGPRVIDAAPLTGMPSCLPDATGRFLDSVPPGTTYGLDAVGSGLAPRWPTQILRTGVSVGTQAIDVGALTLRDGCHVRGSVAGTLDPPISFVILNESIQLNGGCVTLAMGAAVDPTGTFDVLVLPGLGSK